MKGFGSRPIGLLLLLVLASACAALSVQEEKELGAQEQRQVRQQYALMRDAVVVNYVRKLGEELVAHARPSPFELRFFVIEDESLNAFAVPGGAIYVHSGLILAAHDVSELAGVMAHEIGHVTARHTALQYRRPRNAGVVAELVGILGAIFTGQPQAAGLLSELGASAYLNTFSQDAERQADRLGIETLIKSGYDPDGLIRMFETLQRENPDARVPQLLRTHPATPERIANAKKEIQAMERAGAPIGHRSEDGGRLEIIQQRIRLIEGTDRDGEDGNKQPGGGGT